MELVRRLRYFGYLEQLGIKEREPGEVFEKLIEHLAGTQDLSQSFTPANSKPKASKKKPASTRSSKKATKSSKIKTSVPEPDTFASEAVKLHFVIDRRDFLEKVKTVYASYAA